MSKENPYNRLLNPNDEKLKRQFEALCRIQCTQEEIAGVFEVSVSTLKRWIKDVYNCNFEQVFKIYGSAGKASLRRMQMKQAEKSPAVAIFLGKQYLGQKDVVETRNIHQQGDDPLSKAMKKMIEPDDEEDDADD